MAIGKSKSGAKGRKGKGNKRTTDPMLRKDWYDIVAPVNFKNRQFAKSIANKTIGNRVGVENIKGRVYEANYGDLQASREKDDPFRKVRFIVRDVAGRNALTDFYGMELTTDKTRSLMRKWCSTIESVIEADTKDGYKMRIFINAFTRRQPGQLSKNCYAKRHQIEWVRSRMTKMLRRRFQRLSLTSAVNEMTQDTLVDSIQKRCNPVVPLRDVKIRKVKVIKSPEIFNRRVHGRIPESKEGAVETTEVVENAQE